MLEDNIKLLTEYPFSLVAHTRDTLIRLAEILADFGKFVKGVESSFKERE